MKEYVEQFLDFCRYQRSLSENTVQSYKWDLKIFSDWLDDNHLEITSLKIREIDAFIIFLRKNGKAVQTVNRRIYSIKSFFRYLQRIELLEKNPLDFVQNIRQPKPLPKYLTEDQQKALIFASDKVEHRPENQWIVARDRLITLLFLDGGLRVGEMCKIQIEHLNLTDGILRVFGKGSKERETVLSERVIQGIREYLNLMGEIKLDRVTGPGLAARGWNLTKLAEATHTPGTSILHGVKKRRIRKFVLENIEPQAIKYLFFNQQGQAMDTRHIFRIIREIGKRAGIDVHPHLLRHSFATNLVRKKADLLLIQKALGHASVSTTQIYAHLAPGQYREEMRGLIN